MKTVNIIDKNVPLVAIDKSLDKLRDKVMFPEKLEKANKLLKNVKLPAKKHQS